MSEWDALFALARRQGGALHLSDGERYGISRGALTVRARREGWRQPYRGVVLTPGTAATLETRAAAAVAAIGAPVWASRRTAAHLLGIIDRPPARLEFVVPAHRQVTRLAAVDMWRSRTLLPGHTTITRGLPTTTVARTIVDLGAVLDTESLRHVMIDALQRRRVSLEQIRQVRVEIKRVRGGSALSQVLDELDEERCDSRLELEVRRLLHREGLQPHPEPFAFRCPDGVVIHLDIAFPDRWVAIECDGYGFHSSRAAFSTDRVRWGQAQQGGWRLVWVDWSRMRTDPDGVVKEVGANLASADRTRLPAEPAA